MKTVDDESQWTNIIPAPLVAYQYIEELPSLLNQGEWDNFTHVCQYMSPIPQPPALPRILDRVIVNPEPKRRSDNTGMGIMSPAGLDDNSILAVPNHVVLNHLTASAIKNGTLGVGTTTRYRKKVSAESKFAPCHRSRDTCARTCVFRLAGRRQPGKERERERERAES
jgi:hypothetical protein